MPYCTKCGNEIAEQDRFCTKCGMEVAPVLDEGDATRDVSALGSGSQADAARGGLPSNAYGNPSPADGARQAGRTSDTIDLSELDTGGRAANAVRGVERISVVSSADHGVRTGTRSVEDVVNMEFAEGRTAGVGEKPARKVPVGAIAAVVAIIAVIAAIVAFGQLGSCSSSAPASDGPSSEASASGESAEASDAGSDSDAGFAAEGAKASLAEYSWDELSDIADEISAAADADEAQRIAISYRLMQEDGTIDSGNVKDVELAGGQTAQVRVVDVYHDSKSNGSGKAGISFMFTQCVANRPMNSGDYNNGGWESSEARNWLNSDFYNKLPSELRTAIVSVDKETNNVGPTRSLDAVTNTSDKVWLASLAEVAGQVDVILDHSGTENADFNAVLKAEGSQYRAFADLGIRVLKGNKSLKRTYDGDKATWWLRSPSPGNVKLFRAVDESGDPSEFGFASRDHGMMPGFCL